jgi:hypothetical protein
MRRILAVLFTAAPFVAPAVAALSARRDMRMLWMAVVATSVARLVTVATPGKGDVGAASMAFGLATVAARRAYVIDTPPPTSGGVWGGQ